MGEKAGSFPLLEHILLLRADLPSNTASSPRCGGDQKTVSVERLARLAPITMLTTAATPSATALLDAELALRVLLTSFTTDLLQQQQQQRRQRVRIGKLYRQLETAFDDLPEAESSSNGVAVSTGATHRNSFAATPLGSFAWGSAGSPNAATGGGGGGGGVVGVPPMSMATTTAATSSPLLEVAVPPARRRPEVAHAILSRKSACPSPWPLLPVAKEGLYLQVPASGYIHACRRWAAADAADGHGGNAHNEQPPQNAATLLYADTQRYASDSLAAVLQGQRSTHAGAGTSGPAAVTVRRRNDEGFVYGYAMYLCGDIFFSSGDGGESATAFGADGAEEDEKALVLCITSTSPSFNFMREVALEAVQQLCAAAQKAAAAASSASTASSYSSLMLAHLLQALEPFRELTDPCSASCQTLPGQRFTLRLSTKSAAAASGGHSSSVAASASAALPPPAPAPPSFTTTRPSDLLYPYLDTPMATLLLSFPHAALRVLHALLLQESRVVFIGATAQHAAACVLAATSLVTPMVWSSPVIPFVTPTHVAGSGLLDTLLAPSAEMAARRRAARRQHRAVPQSSSALLESGGYLLGSTAPLVPQLMLRLSAIASSVGRNDELWALGGTLAGADSRQANALERERLWIADARSGNIGVVPLEPLSVLFTQTVKDKTIDSVSATPATASSVLFPSRTQFQRRVLKHAQSQNAAIMASFALVDIPPAHDKLKNAVKNAVSSDQRLAFRIALETMAALDHDRRSTRGEEQEQLELILRRIRLRLDGTAEGREGPDGSSSSGVGRQDTAHASFHPSDNDNDTTTTFDADGNDDSASDSDLESSESAHVTPSSAFPQTLLQRDPSAYSAFSGTGGPTVPSTSPSSAGNTSFTGARVTDHASHYRSSGGGSGLPNFPVVSPAAIIEVHGALLELNSHRLFGNYRKGLLYSQSKVVGINVAAFLAGNLNNNFKLTEAISGTHMYKQFEKGLLSAESLGLHKVLRGEFIPLSLSAPPTSRQQQQQQGSGAGSTTGTVAADSQLLMTTNYYVSHPRMVSLLNLFVERSKRKFGDMFPDIGAINGTSASAMVHASMMAVANDGVAYGHRVAVAAVTPTLVNAPPASQPVVNPSRNYRVPAIAFIAGYEGTPLLSSHGDSTSAAYGGHVDTTSASMPPVAAAQSSGSGGGVRRFFAKATRAVKHSLGGGGGSNSSSTTHVATVPIPVYVQAFCSFADGISNSSSMNNAGGGGVAGTLTAADAKTLTQLSRRNHRRTKRRLTHLIALTNGKQRRHKGTHSAKAGTAADSAALASFGGTGDARGCSNRMGGKRKFHRHSPSVDVSLTAADESESEQLLEEEAARSLALRQQAALAIEFAMPEGLNASEQSLLASAAAAASGEDGIAITSSGGDGGGGGGGNGGQRGGVEASYVSGMGVENEYMRQIATGPQAGAGAGHSKGHATADFPDFVGFRGPVLCRPLPLDTLHQFGAYHALLKSFVSADGGGGEEDVENSIAGNGHTNSGTVDDAAQRGSIPPLHVRFHSPVARLPGTTTSYLSPIVDVAFPGESAKQTDGRRGSALADASDEARYASVATEQVELYASLGALCPSNVAAWLSAERLAEIALLRPQPLNQAPQAAPHRRAITEAAKQSSFKPAAAGPVISTTRVEASTTQPPPQRTSLRKQEELQGESPRRRALFDELFDDLPMTQTSLSDNHRDGNNAAADGGSGGGPLPSFADWGAFTSGVPEDFACSAPTASAFPAPVTAVATVTSDWSSGAPTAPPAAYLSPSRRLQQDDTTTNAENGNENAPQRQESLRDSSAWEGWGMQAPTAVVSFPVESETQQPLVPPSTTTAPAPGSVMDQLFSFATPPSGGALSYEDFFRS